MNVRGGGARGARWNDEEQRWETGSPDPAPYTSPPPTKPGFVPGPGSAPTPGADFFTEETADAMNPPAYPPPTSPPPYPSSHAPAAAPGTGPSAARMRAWSTPVVVGAAVAVVAAGFGGGWLLWGGDDTTVRSDARTSASPTAPPQDRNGATAPPGVPSGTTASGSSSGALPSGYRLARDSAGFSIAVPEGWQRTQRTDGVFYTAPDERYLLQIFEITEPDITPREALQATSRDLAGKPGYVQMSLGPVPDIGLSTGATELVYAYDSEKLGVRARVIDRAFTVPDGRQFAVLVLGPDAEWPAQARIQQTALRHFSPNAP
ncbi:hypothetical protein ADK76_18455 [Streptomyces griseoflavus]|uniref:hypothetical protein n=1 Tax=Streptomyces rimosus TaxID=1927 RepID=UPI0004CA4468|nr:hypothetical protein [Streptomyces rimosus]KOG57053.1 hypothetical protein ADK76_18455 [Streptomyces griseoflavus]